MDKKVLAVGALFGMTAIMLGAFGAHKLKELISPESVAVFETGVRYQIYHAIFLLFVGVAPMVSEKAKNALLWLVIAGVLLFSGSIYFLACNTLFSIDFAKIGFITPIGGFLLISAWVVLFLHIIKQKR